MIVETAAILSADALTLAFAKGIRNAKRTWLGAVKAHVMQVRPAAGEAWESAAVIRNVFLFRVELKGDTREAGQVFTVDNKKLHRAVAVIGATDQAAFARIQAGKPVRGDCDRLVQLAVFGFERF